MADDKQQIADDSKTPIDYQKEIHAPSLEDIMDEEADIEQSAKEGKPPVEAKPDVKEETKIEEKTEEKPKEEVKAAPAIDEEKLTDNIASKLIDKLSPPDATKDEKKDLRTDIRDLQKKAKDEGRELTYDEALEFLAEKTRENVKEELKDEIRDEIKKDLQKEAEDEEAKETKQREEAQAYEKKRTEAWNSQWDVEEKKLEDAGKLPAIADPKDPNDAGRRERLALFEAMKKHNEDAIKNGNPNQVTMNLVEFHTLYFKSPNEKPAGANEPVAGARRAVTPTSANDFSYADIHRSSLEDIATGK